MGAATTLQFGTYIFPNDTFEIEGMPFEMRLDSAEIPRRAGARIIANRVGQRKIRIKGTIHGTDAGSIWNELNVMLQGLSNGEQPLRYRTGVEFPSWMEKFGHEFVKGGNPLLANVKIELSAANPYPRGTAPLSTVVALTTVGTLDLVITNAGLANTNPAFILTALGLTVSGGITIKNMTTGEQIQYTGAIPPGASVTIDTDAMTVLEGQTNRVDKLEGILPKLVPGSNTIRVSGATYRFELNYYERFYA